MINYSKSLVKIWSGSRVGICRQLEPSICQTLKITLTSVYNIHKILFIIQLLRYVVWRNRPMRELLKFRNLKERDCTTVAERCRVLPHLSSPRFAPHLALLGCAVTLDGATVRKAHVTSVTSRATVQGAAFTACRIQAFIGETEGSAVRVAEYGSRVVEYKSASLVQVSSQPIRSELSA
jgi:hypothetical protein